MPLAFEALVVVDVSVDHDEFCMRFWRFRFQQVAPGGFFGTRQAGGNLRLQVGHPGHVTEEEDKVYFGWKIGDLRFDPRALRRARAARLR